ncbi:MAG TPA: ribonuclease D [Planktothrix sp.]|jgi:ribonuclease D
MALITKERELNELCDRILSGKRCAIDLEFVPERTYEPILCLVQVATEHGAALVDPLALPDLSRLWDALNAEDMLVVLHAGNQDLDLVYSLSGSVPGNVFDTQIAAGFAGFGYPVGYGKLLSQLLGVTIAKSESFTDWTNRPLSQSQIEYATEDVCHLLPMYDKLCEKLGEFGRLEWAVEECRRLSNPERYHHDHTQDFLRVKGASSLSRRGLGVLQALCDWRTNEARRVNRPARSVVADNILLELARKPPKEVNDIQRIRGIRVDQIRGYGNQMLTAIERGKRLAEEECPSWPSSRVPPKKEVLLADVLFACLKVMTYDVDVATELVATRDDLQALCRLHREQKLETSNLPLLHGWRHEMAGNKIVELLKGSALAMTFDTHKDPPVHVQITSREKHPAG